MLTPTTYQQPDFAASVPPQDFPFSGNRHLPGRVEPGGEATGPEWPLSAVGDTSLVAGVRDRLDTRRDDMGPGVRDVPRSHVPYGNLETPVHLPRPDQTEPQKGIWPRPGTSALRVGCPRHRVASTR